MVSYIEIFRNEHGNIGNGTTDNVYEFVEL